MASHPNPRMMTVEEFYDLPERDDVDLELHNGHIVELSTPKYWHVKLQRHIARMLESRCDDARRTVSVTMPNGKAVIYKGNDEIPVPLLNTSLKVSEIWID